MRRAAWFLAPVLILVLGSAPVRAASSPVFDVDTFGLELCPQSICHAAIFAGFVVGRVGNNPFAVGTFVVVATHEPLPEPGETADLIDGSFELRFGLRRFRGTVEGGSLFNTGLNTFEVTANLKLDNGDELLYQGLLDHNVFPPTVAGPMVSVP